MKTHRHLILLAVCLGGMGSLHAAGERVKPSRACPPSVRGHHLEIKALAAPGMVDPHERFNTFVTAVDERGVGFIDVEFNDQKVRIDGKGERFVTAIAVFSARPPGVPRVDNTSRTDTLNTLRATVVAVDGRTRGAPRIKQVGVEGPEATQATEPMADFRERLADINYPAITGATANASWNVTPLSVDLRPWWTKWVEKGGPQHWNWAGHVEPGITAIGEDGKVLRAWLDLHPNVASNLVWAELDPTLGSKDPWGMPAGAVTHLSYPYWTDFMKYQLNIAVFRAWQYLNSGAASFNGTPLPPIAKNRMTLADHEGSTTLLNRDDAWNLYLGTVAHSLAVEIGGFVPWSITNYKLSDLSVLLNAVTMYDHIGGLSWYVTTTETRSASGYFVHQVLPAPPVVNFNFMLEHDMIRPDHTRTITRYFDWGRKAFYHTGVRLDPKGKVQDGTDAFSAEAYWGYRGATPASQVQKGM